jgi:predicted nucleotidyltransferase/transcriptional regulator with XRE-family HTH domain
MGRKFGVVREGAVSTGEGLSLAELRQARQLSQEALAERLGTRQASISKLEGREDMHLSTLRAYVGALGGKLDLTARFPDGDVPIRSFGEPTSYQYPVARKGREPMRLHERPVPVVQPRRVRRKGAVAGGRRSASLDELRALRGPILEIASRHGASNLRVFGSVVRSEMRPDSDVDVLVSAGKKVGPWFPGGLAAELGELLGRRVDVVTEQALAPELRESVLQEAVPL